MVDIPSQNPNIIQFYLIHVFESVKSLLAHCFGFITPTSLPLFARYTLNSKQIKFSSIADNVLSTEEKHPVAGGDPKRGERRGDV